LIFGVSLNPSGEDRSVATANIVINEKTPAKIQVSLLMINHPLHRRLTSAWPRKTISSGKMAQQVTN
jgi:hypothetical protein